MSVETNACQHETRGSLAFSDKLLNRGFLFTIVLACAVAISPNTVDPDLWGHVQFGRDALVNGIPSTTTYSFTAEGYPWINHENLAEILYAVIIDAFGPVGLLIFKCLLGVGILILILSRFPSGSCQSARCAMVLLVGTNLAFHWSCRPQLLTYVYFAIMLVALSWCFAGWQDRWNLPWLRDQNAKEDREDRTDIALPTTRLRWLCIAPALFAVWANSHGGFVAGYCIFSAYLVLRAVEIWLMRGRESWRTILWLALMVLAAGLGTLANPYGLRLHAWLLESLAAPRPEISEWHPPYFFDTLAIPVWLMLTAALASVLFTRCSRDFTHLVILGIILWQGMRHQRHLAFFAIAFGFWMAPAFHSLMQRFVSASTEMSLQTRRVLSCCLVLTLGLTSAKLYGRLSDLPVNRSDYPISAFQFMADHDLRGKLVVTYDWAQYAIAAFGTSEESDAGVRVSFDGRFRTCYPQQLVDMHFDFIVGNGDERFRNRGADSPPFRGDAILSCKAPDLALTNRALPHSTKVLETNKDTWCLLYQDEIAQLWGRRSKYDDPESPDYVALSDRRVTDERQVGSVTWPALPIAHDTTFKLAKESHEKSQLVKVRHDLRETAPPN